MKSILVSGASGIIGYGVLRSLRKSQKALRLIGTTIYDDSVAQGFCDVFEQAVITSNSAYIDWLLQIINKYHVDLIIPGIEADMYKWVEHAPEIEKSGTKVLLNNPELISLCKDKWLFYESLKRVQSENSIETSLDNNFKTLVSDFGLPFLLKPRSGHGSKGLVKIDGEDTYNKHQQYVGSVLMAQPIVGDDDHEFTTSAFCDGQGKYFAKMTLKRKLSKDGFTEKAEVISLDGVDSVLESLCAHFKPLGPTNFQFRMHNGVLKLLEINPRISSSTSIRTAFGYNESEMAIDFFLENRAPEQPAILEGRAVRYIEDFVFYS